MSNYKVYYNEWLPFNVSWLRNLTKSNIIPQGMVDQRDIKKVLPSDCANTSHFFAGIGGWPIALKYAGWNDNQPVWTGSCPCQPFSVCGSREGVTDERHLWPEFFRLIKHCRPPIIFGEQVAGKSGLQWLDGVFNDMEGIGYSCGAASLPACSIGSPQKRQRLFWVAYSQRVARIRPIMRNDSWSHYNLIDCTDGGMRRTCNEPIIHPLVNGIPRSMGQSITRAFRLDKGPNHDKESIKLARRNGVGRIDGYGNAIVPQLATMFIISVVEAINNT